MFHFVPMSVPSGKCHTVTSGVLPNLLQPGFPGVLLAQCYSPDSHAVDRHARCDSCMPVPIGPCRFGFTTSHSARVLSHMDATDTIIYVSQKAQTVPGHGKAAPVGIPCMRLQSDMRCYRLDRCDLESGFRQRWHQSRTACRFSKPNWSMLSLEIL